MCVAYGIFTFYTISLSSEKLRAGCDCKTLTELSRSARVELAVLAVEWTAAQPTRDGVCDSPLPIMVKLCRKTRAQCVNYKNDFGKRVTPEELYSG